MKKVLFGALIVGIAVFVIYKVVGKKNDDSATPDVKQQPLTTSKNSAAFNESFDKLLTSYLELKNALVDYDTLKINTIATALSANAEALKTSEIKGDSTGDIKTMAGQYAASISGSAKAIPAEKELTKKKREFQLISESLYELIRTVRYDKIKLYHQLCPMAFNDEEQAAWISDSREIVNPYLGNKHPKYKNGMLHCGEITDSLDYSR